MSITNAKTKNPKCTTKRYDAVNILNLPNNHLVHDHVTMRIPVSHDHFEQMESALQKSFVLRANELVDGNLSKRRRNWWLTDSQLSKGRMGLVPLFEVLRVNFTEGSIQWGHNYHSHPLWYCVGHHHHQNHCFPSHVSFHHHPHQRHNYHSIHHQHRHHHCHHPHHHEKLRLKLAWSLTGRVPLQYWGDNCRGSFSSPSMFNIPFVIVCVFFFLLFCTIIYFLL